MDRRRRLLKCSMCFYETNVEASLVSHYVRNHKNDPRFFVTCHNHGCGATYKNWNSYKIHVKRCHRPAAPAAAEMDIDNDENLPQPNEGHPNLNDDIVEQIPLHDIEGGDVDVLRGLQINAAQFLLFIRDKCKTSGRAMAKIMDGTQDLLSQYTSAVKIELEKVVDPISRKVNLEDINHVLDSLMSPTTVFEAINTKTKLENFMRTSMNKNNIDKVEMGKRLVWKYRPVIDVVEKTAYCYYTPFLPALTRLLQNQQVRYCVDNPRENVGKLKSVLDGEFYKDHPFFKSNKNALAIILYYDEVNYTNPIGSKTHKLGMFYWSLANIWPEYRSTFQAINLLATVSYIFIKRYGVKNVLERFSADINKLMTDGVTVNVNGMQRIYKGSLLFVTADTPAAALVGGFKESVSAAKMCRRCMADQNQFKLYFTEEHFVLRVMESHHDHVLAVTDETTTVLTQKFWSRFYGVNKRTNLLDINGFDVTKCLVQDIMHVLAEGVVEIETRKLISYCIDNTRLSLVALNERVENFTYGHLSKDKPSSIDSPHLTNGLRQSAAQMICLAHVLPFLILDLLKSKDEDTEHNGAHERLLCHIRLLQIVNCAFAFSTSKERAQLLRRQIEVFNLKFSRLYPESLVPKFHFLIHLPNQIIAFGPARQQSCMRFEAAHSWYKTLSRVTRNYKNLAYTFAERSEALRCLELAAAPGSPDPRFLYSGHSVKHGQRQRLVDLARNVLEHLHNDGFNVDIENGSVMLSPEVTIHGTTYKRNSVVLISCKEDELPLFASVKEILIFNTHDIFFVCSSIETLFFSQELNAYGLNFNGFESIIISARNLLHPHPLSSYTFENKKYVILMNHDRSEFVE